MHLQKNEMKLIVRKKEKRKRLESNCKRIQEEHDKLLKRYAKVLEDLDKHTSLLACKDAHLKNSFSLLVRDWFK